MLTADDLRKAMRRAFHLGQTYWMYADSESFIQIQKADSVQAKFNELVEETVAAAGVGGTDCTAGCIDKAQGLPECVGRCRAGARATPGVTTFQPLAPAHVADPRGPEFTRINQHDAIVHPAGVMASDGSQP